MIAERWRNVRLGGVEWLLFDDALVRLAAVEGVRSVAPEAGPEGDDRGIVELRGGGELRVHFLGPRDQDVAPADLMGLEDRDGRVAAFADGGALWSEVVAIVRDGGLASVWFAQDEPPWLFTARPYPWATA